MSEKLGGYFGIVALVFVFGWAINAENQRRDKLTEAYDVAYSAEDMAVRTKSNVEDLEYRIAELESQVSVLTDKHNGLIEILSRRY